MIIRSLHILALCAVSFFALVAFSMPSDAGTLPHPFAPWMALEDRVNEAPATEEMEKIRPRLQRMAAKEKNTNLPVITPEDTLELINQIYDEDTQPSVLEQAYSKRIVEQLTQFGYDMFGTDDGKKGDKEKDESAAMPAGAVQDDFLLNIGDRLTVTFRGQRQDSKTYIITNDGQLIVDQLPPVLAAGRTMGAVRDALQAEAEKQHNTEVFISLDSVRQVNVLIVGHVKKPGRQTLTVFDTVIDALMGAGGVQKTGSLRQIKLVRDGRSTIIDLYALLVHGSAIMDITLRNGDRIIVPPIGPTVAIAGGVKRPGIYEIEPAPHGLKYNDAGEKLSMNDLLGLAGGTLAPARTRFLKLGLTTDGRETVDEIADPLKPVFSDGGILMVAPAVEARVDTVELTGDTRLEGIHALDKASTLAALLDSDKALGPDIYPLIGVIERQDKKQLSPRLIAFPPLMVVHGAYDQKLMDGDVVHLFSRTQIMALQKNDGALPPPEPAYGDKEAIEDDLIDDPVMKSFLREHTVFVRGAVRGEGPWPVAQGINLENVIAAAGGPTLEASTNGIEVTSKVNGNTQRLTINKNVTDPATVMIHPGDTVRIGQKFKKVKDNSVLLIGEVPNPGRYDLAAGDHLSDLIRRAGGLTRQAYPEGAIFSRESERKAEEARFRAQAQELEVRLAAAMNQKDEPDANQIASVQELVGQLRHAEAVGRITVEADPGALAAHPDEDILLEAGDRVYIPQHPLTVRVAGEVLSPASLQFGKDKDARDYIAEAGGLTFDADKNRAFVLYPDGSARPLHVGGWNSGQVFIPPGSTIVVPRDPKPFDFMQAARDVTQILSNLAITGIFIQDIQSGN